MWLLRFTCGANRNLCMKLLIKRTTCCHAMHVAVASCMSVPAKRLHQRVASDEIRLKAFFPRSIVPCRKVLLLSWACETSQSHQIPRVYHPPSLILSSKTFEIWLGVDGSLASAGSFSKAFPDSSHHLHSNQLKVLRLELTALQFL